VAIFQPLTGDPGKKTPPIDGCLAINQHIY